MEYVEGEYPYAEVHKLMSKRFWKTQHKQIATWLKISQPEKHVPEVIGPLLSQAMYRKPCKNVLTIALAIAA